MKVRDRITGTRVTLPAKFQPERYEIISGNHLQNGHTKLEQGSLLIDDGFSDCVIGELKGEFILEQLNSDEKKKLEFLAVTIRTIAVDKEKDPSPLLPRKLINLSDLTKLEIKLNDVVDEGHLQEIARRPRLDMHYEEQVTQISRARRLAPSAERHLASNSSSWQQKTISGIIPKSILALFSEDDYNIYENKLYARLLDRLEKLLNEHLLDVSILSDTYKKAEQFQSQHHYRRLRETVCSIWGETSQDEETEKLIQLSKDTIDTISKLLRVVRGMKQSDLYKSIPRSAQIPNEVHTTNILLHDQHYRHLVPLWELHRKETLGRSKTPGQILLINHELSCAYFDYVGILLRRAIKQLSCLIYNKINVKISKSNFEWTISTTSGDSVTFVPFSQPITIPLQKHNTTESRVFLHLYGDYKTFDISAILNENGSIFGGFVISPLDFLVEEKIVAFLKAWLYRPVLKNYGKEIDKIPTPVVQILSSYDHFKISNHKVKILKPVQDNIIEQLEKLLKQHASEEVTAALLGAIRELEHLSTCQQCGKRGRFEARELDTFISVCDNCKLEWGVFKQDEKRKAIFTVLDNNTKKFDLYGRWHMELNI